jgi:hypothetical protein
MDKDLLDGETHEAFHISFVCDESDSLDTATFNDMLNSVD